MATTRSKSDRRSKPETEPKLVLTAEPDRKYAATSRNQMTAKALHWQLFDAWENSLIEELIHATHKVVHPAWNAHERLPEIGVTAQEGVYASTLAQGWCHPRYVEAFYEGSLAQYETPNPFWLAVRLTHRLGQGSPTLTGYKGSLSDVYAGPVQIFRRSEVTPKVCVRLGTGIWDRRRDTRVRAMEYLCEMATGCEVHLVSSPNNLDKIRRKHAGRLEDAVSEYRDTSLQSLPSVPARIVDRVEEGLFELDSDDAEWDLLRMVYTTDRRQCRYSDIQQAPNLPGGKSRKRQLVTNLKSYEFIERVEVAGDTYIATLPAGEYAYERYQEEQEKQRELGDWV